ncbi:hypothetical protein BMS3Abin16_01049 [archaeon BMS3Abin16]|nr:hypothetical protein BMS3Abin16_01049 [archaeon BMS3Abin16]
MLDEKKIKNAEANVRHYLQEGLLRKINKRDANIQRVLQKNSEESLKTADLLLKGNYSTLWAVVCSYYAMYYAANGALYSIGYKVGHKISHKVTSDALVVYVRKKLKESLLKEFEDAQEEALEIAGLQADELVESFGFERLKRSRFQYEMTEEIKRSKAETSLGRAKRFVFEMEKLLEEG